MQSAELFDVVTALVFDRLYTSFPVAVNLEYQSFAKELAELEPSKDGRHLQELFGSTVAWLRDEGYLRSKMASSDGDYYHVVLTASGLSALNAAPRSVSGQPAKSNIQTIRAGLRSTGGAIMQEVVRAGVRAIIDAARGL